MRNPKFTLLAEEFKRFLISGTIEYLDEPLWHLTLVDSELQKTEEIQWIKKIVTQNTKQGIRTVLITVYDIISPQDLKSRGILDFDDLFIVRMYQKGKLQKEPFEEQIMSINDDINELGILFDDLVKFTNEKKIRCQVILYTLSTLIHIHGSKRLYSLLISKLPLIKGSQLQAYLLYYTKSHNDSHSTNLLQTIMDETIKLE